MFRVVLLPAIALLCIAALFGTTSADPCVDDRFGEGNTCFKAYNVCAYNHPHPQAQCFAGLQACAEAVLTCKCKSKVIPTVCINGHRPAFTAADAACAKTPGGCLTYVKTFATTIATCHC